MSSAAESAVPEPQEVESEVEPVPEFLPVVERPTQESLIQDNQGLVISLAKQIHGTLPRNRVELDDLIGYGQIGLAEAARIFNPDLNVKFSTYSYYRIRGAIFDGLSQMSWFAKAQRAEARYQKAANNALQDESEESVDNSARSQSRWFGNMTRTLAVVYLTTHGSDDDDSATDIVDESAVAPSTTAADSEISQKLVELIDTLPDDAKSLVRATYFEGLTLQEAGQRLGISKSWASRLHARALDQLGRALKGIGAD